MPRRRKREVTVTKADEALLAGAKPKRHKYNAVPTVVEGKRFASKKEAGEYSKLLALEKRGAIRGLRTQVPFRLEVNGVLVCKFVADFVFDDLARGGYRVVADAKGFRTPAYRIKKKLMKALHGIDILEL